VRGHGESSWREVEQRKKMSGRLQLRPVSICVQGPIQ
jgi:hypothetical protein